MQPTIILVMLLWLVVLPRMQWSPTPISLPTGALLLFSSGTSCPPGTVEATDLDGRNLTATTLAHADVGTTGGTDSVTPAGTNGTSTVTPLGTNGSVSITPLLNAIAWPAGVPTFAGNVSTTVVNHLHTLATGSGASGNFSQVIGTVDTTSGGTGGTPTQTALGTLSSNPTAGGAANYTPAGTVAWPAGVPTVTGASTTVGAQTFTGSSSTVGAQTFTGAALENRSAFMRVIVCRAN